MTKRRLDDLGIFGGKPEFQEPVHVGQLNLPSWERFEEAFSGIFARRYFTNHGPLVRELDQRLAGYLGVRNVVCVTNGTVALMVACKALDLHGEVIVPSFTFPATVQALSWAGLTPVFCDIDAHTHNISAALAEPLISPRTCAILGVHVWGRACDPAGLQRLCDARGIRLFFDAAHGLGCEHDGSSLATLGDVAIYSFHATKVFSSAEGGCLATNDDRLAERIRTVRNFHVAETFDRVPLRINGKMTEAQAAMGLLSLENLDDWILRNMELYRHYAEWDAKESVGAFVDYVGGQRSNHQYCMFDIDPARLGISRNQMLAVMRAENVLARRYFYPGVHRLTPYNSLSPDADRFLPATLTISERLLQLPLGAGIDLGTVDRITAIMEICHQHAGELRARMDPAIQQ